MSFSRKDIDKLLSDVGRMCCICNHLHKVQIHHIIPTSQGGSNDIENAIALCPNCHDEVHKGYAPGRVSRIYTVSELKQHRKRTIDIASRGNSWRVGTPDYKKDKKLVLYYAQCLDRPAFKTPFHQELRFSDFDQAIEDTILAINTGYWRTRDGAVIGRSKGKSYIINPIWRKKVDDIVSALELVRSKFRSVLSLDTMMYTTYANRDFIMERKFRRDDSLRRDLDSLRNKAIDIMNTMLSELGHQPLQTIPIW